MIDFTTAMNTACPMCDKPAKLHRLDSRNNLYCLVLGYEGRKKRDTMGKLGHMWTDDMCFTLPTMYLRMSDIPQSVGYAINKALNTSTTTVSSN